MGTMPTPQPRTLGDTVRWRVFYRVKIDGRAKQTCKTFENHGAAQRWCDLIARVGIDEALRILESWGQVGDGARTVRTWALERVDAMSGVGADYVRRCRRVAENDLGALAELPLEGVTHDDVARWVNALADGGSSGKTIKNKHGFLSSVFEQAVRKGLIERNPCKGTRLPRTVTEEMTILTHDEFARFLGFFTPHWQPLVTLLFSSGLRFSEATALTVGDVNIETRQVSVTKAWKDNGKTLGPPKSRRSRRNASIPQETIDALAPLLDRPADARLFVNQRGDTVRLQTFHDNAWDPAVRLANGEPGQKPGPKAKRVARRLDATGAVILPAKADEVLGKRPRVHDARHSCASWLLAAGVPINYVQAQLGHESITTTVDRYGHLVPGASAAISDALSLAMSSAFPQIES